MSERRGVADASGDAPIGIIANPASGKDIRRLVAHASVFDNDEKSSIVRRVILGAHAAGARRFLYLSDPHQLVERAIDRIGLDGLCCEPLESPGTDSALDTIVAAGRMREAGCGVVVTLGGDGTNRAVALGWLDLPLVAISTGTNNVFPRLLEGTVAGAAAGLVATGRVPLGRVALQAKRVQVEIEGEKPDLALIDAVLVDGRFIGARALWEARALRAAVLTRAEPAAVGIAAVAGLVAPLRADEDAGLLVRFGGTGRSVLAPIAPGLFERVPLCSAEPLTLGCSTTFEGPGLLALDGERECALKPGQRVILTVLRDGPRVIDVDATLLFAAQHGLFCLGAAQG